MSMMQRCPFAAAIITERAACRHAEQVVRRGGSEYDCRSQPDQQACQALFERLKAAAFPAFGVEDDLAVMPHSALVKIQAGGLLGLSRLVGDIGGRIVHGAHGPRRLAVILVENKQGAVEAP